MHAISFIWRERVLPATNPVEKGKELSLRIDLMGQQTTQLPEEETRSSSAAEHCQALRMVQPTVCGPPHATSASLASTFSHRCVSMCSKWVIWHIAYPIGMIIHPILRKASHAFVLCSLSWHAYIAHSEGFPTFQLPEDHALTFVCPFNNGLLQCLDLFLQGF